MSGPTLAPLRDHPTILPEAPGRSPEATIADDSVWIDDIFGENVYLDDLFGELLEVGDPERRLAELCAVHPTMAPDLRAMWAAHAAVGDPQEPDLKLEPGVVLGQYRLDAPLGDGATASVWRATDTRFRRPVALKVFDRQVHASQSTLDQVMGEAQSASAVLSEHVVRVRDAGRLPGSGLHFIAMELCADFPEGADQPVVGRTLDDEEPRSLHEAVAWAAQIARGVADAHRAGVFHRDLKPANVLVRPGSRRAQILDFGLATLTRSFDVDASPRRTVSVVVGRRKSRVCIAGTPAYMAPEQARGLPWDTDPVRDRHLLTRIDVYGVGAVLYTLLAGRPPYIARPEAEHPGYDVLAQARRGDHPPIRSLDTHLRVPPRLARVVDRAMAADPDDRYEDATELAWDLEAFLAHHPTSLDRRRPVLTAGLWTRRHPMLLVAALWLVFLTLGGLWTLRLRGEMAEAYARRDEAHLAEQAAWSDARAAQDAAAAAEFARKAAESRSAVATADAQDARKIAVAAEAARATAQEQARAALEARQSAEAEAAAATMAAEESASEADKSRIEAQAADARAIDAQQAAARAESRAADSSQAAAEARASAQAADERATRARAEAQRSKDATTAAEIKQREAESEAARWRAVSKAAEVEAARWKERLEAAQAAVPAEVHAPAPLGP